MLRANTEPGLVLLPFLTITCNKSQQGNLSNVWHCLLTITDGSAQDVGICLNSQALVSSLKDIRLIAFNGGPAAHFCFQSDDFIDLVFSPTPQLDHDWIWRAPCMVVICLARFPLLPPCRHSSMKSLPSRLKAGPTQWLERTQHRPFAWICKFPSAAFYMSSAGNY